MTVEMDAFKTLSNLPPHHLQTSSKPSSKSRRISKAKQRRLKEYRQLANLVPSLATVVDSTSENVSTSDEIVIINETIKHMKMLENMLIMQVMKERQLKDPLSRKDRQEK